MKAKSGSYESAQTGSDGLSTGQFGGKAPGAKEVIKAANARSMKRHDMHGNNDYGDVNVLPDSLGETLDRAGIKDSGYLTKKGLVYGVEAFYNSLPPGSDIEDQENIDSRVQPLKNYSGGLGYPGDGAFGQGRGSIK